MPGRSERGSGDHVFQRNGGIRRVRVINADAFCFSSHYQCYITLTAAISDEAMAILRMLPRISAIRLFRPLFIERSAVSNWPTSSREETSISALRSPLATRCASVTAAASGRTIDCVRKCAIRMLSRIAAVSSISNRLRLRAAVFSMSALIASICLRYMLTSSCISARN